MGNTPEKQRLLSQIAALKSEMTFHRFANGKSYSFDYGMEASFLRLSENGRKKLPRSASNALPVFLPRTTRRISFSHSVAKSVRKLHPSKIEKILTARAEKICRHSDSGEVDCETVMKKVGSDLVLFNEYHSTHPDVEYRIDIATPAITFRAYDENDLLLIENSFVKGGLVFDLSPEQFQNVEITYPRHRKKRSDTKTDYLPLELVKIRPFNKSDV